jgi:hypothetical protein
MARTRVGRRLECRRLIDAHQYVLDGEWGDVQLRAEQQNDSRDSVRENVVERPELAPKPARRAAW